MRSSIPPFVSRGMLLILVFSGCGKSADGPVVPETIGGVSKDTAVDGLDEDERLDFCLALRDVPSVPALEVSMEGACVAAVLSMDVSEQDECAELRDMCVETDGDPTEFEAFSGLEQAFNENMGLIFTMSDDVLLGEGIPILELPEGMEIQDMILVNHLGEVIEALLDVGPENMIPDEFAVHQNYPNPFNPVTTIQVDLNKQTALDVSVFDIMGRQLKQLATGSWEPGYHFIDWHGQNEQGNEVASGTYFIMIRTPEHRKVIKAVYLR